ncbi:hypothetical protein CesoFtcFv8_026240 [Champsocephalus esox]|uniref:Uncharacterized protein n=1 Tax=Champsocephalus esox TaxID=159716 RepID=A0AAN8GCC9_9TELE|nr:hypothetical protein CesoFtcFv8_026240 [Champsocephalus esox]
MLSLLGLHFDVCARMSVRVKQKLTRQLITDHQGVLWPPTTAGEEGSDPDMKGDAGMEKLSLPLGTLSASPTLCNRTHCAHQ